MISLKRFDGTTLSENKLNEIFISLDFVNRNQNQKIDLIEPIITRCSDIFHYLSPWLITILKNFIEQKFDTKNSGFSDLKAFFRNYKNQVGIF